LINNYNKDIYSYKRCFISNKVCSVCKKKKKIITVFH